MKTTPDLASSAQLAAATHVFQKRRASRLCRSFALLVMLLSGFATLITPGAADDGVPVWTNRFVASPGSTDKPCAVAVDGSGIVFVTGPSAINGGAVGYMTVAYSEAGALLWTNRYDGPGNDDNANAIAVDASGNVFVTGTSWNGNNYDYLTVAYSNAALPLWTNRYNGPADSYDIAAALVVDGTGNVFVTGHSANANGEDYATIKYSNAGVPAWTNRYNGTGSGFDEATAVKVDGSGNVYVTGHSAASSTPPYNDGYATIKYSSEGVLLWVNRFYSGPPDAENLAVGLAVATNGNVYVTGKSFASSDPGLPGNGTLGYADYGTVAYSDAGIPLWTNFYNGPANGSDLAQAMAVDESGNVFVTGYSEATPGGNANYATLAYSAAGLPLWTNRYSGPNSIAGDIAHALAVDKNGNVFVTGESSGSGTSRDYLTLAYSGAGIPLWTNRYNGPLNNQSDVATSLAVDASGNVFVTGYSPWGGGNPFSYVTIKYPSLYAPANITLSNSSVAENQPIGTTVGTLSATTRVSDNQHTFALVTGAGDTDNASFSITNGTNLVTAAVFDYELKINYDIRVRATGSNGLSSEKPFSISVINVRLLTPVWTNLYNGPGNNTDQAKAVAVDASGNVFVTGQSVGSGSSYDYSTIKYSSAGVPLWTNRYNGPGNNADYAIAIAMDTNSNLFVAGYSYGGSSGWDYATIKYSDAGVALWTNRYSGSGNNTDQVTGMALDNNGNVFVTGYSSSGGINDYATVAYSGAGLPLWTNRYNGPGNDNDFARAIAVTSNGNIVVTGSSYDSTSAIDYATIAYSGAGVPLWTNRYNGPGNNTDQANAIAADKNGNVFVTGFSHNENGNYDYATVAYSGAGLPLWTNRYDMQNRIDQANAIAVDKDGNVFVTGHSNDSVTYDFATVAYSGAGVPLWTNRYEGTGLDNDYARAIALDSRGNVVVTGESHNGTTFDFVTVSYSGTGIPLWTNRYDGPVNLEDYSVAIAVDGHDDVFVAGYSGANTSGYNYTTIKYAGPVSIQPSAITLSQTVAANSQFQFQFNADANLTYTVEFRDSFAAGNWATLANIGVQSVATNISITVLSTNNARFYRVRTP
jgi:uncharacterized delta-60 repeat protein